MKTLKNTGITLMLAIVASAAALAQSPNPVLAKAEAFAPIEVSHSQLQAVAKVKTFDTSLYRLQKSMKMRLSIEKNAGKTVSVRLLNHEGKELHRRMISRRINKYGCNFDFAKVKDGRYTIEVANGDEVQHRTINLSSAEVVETPSRTLVALN